MTPFLTLVLAGYAAFILVLGVYWVRSYMDGLKVNAARKRS